MCDNIKKIKEVIYSAKQSFEKIDNSNRFESESSFAIQLLTENNFLLDQALRNPESLKNAIVNIASLKTTLNPADKKAYLVPRAGKNPKVDLTISYIGLIDLAVTEGAILWAQTKLVYSNDDFSIRGYDNAPIHKYNPFSTDRGNLVGVYCVAKYPNGDYITEAMTIEDVESIKKRSPGASGKFKTPWDTDFKEMTRKTVVKRAAKYWQGSQQLNNAIHYLNTDAQEGINFEEEKQDVSEIKQLKKDLMFKLIEMGIDKHTMPLFINQSNINVNETEALKETLANQDKLLSLVNKFMGKEEETQQPKDLDTQPKAKKTDQVLIDNLYNMFAENGINTQKHRLHFADFIGCNINNEKHVRLWLNRPDDMTKLALDFCAQNLNASPSLEEIENDKTELSF